MRIYLRLYRPGFLNDWSWSASWITKSIHFRLPLGWRGNVGIIHPSLPANFPAFLIVGDEKNKAG